MSCLLAIIKFAPPPLVFFGQASLLSAKRKLLSMEKWQGMAGLGGDNGGECPTLTRGSLWASWLAFTFLNDWIPSDPR
jgi:hypothetical protein